VWRLDRWGRPIAHLVSTLQELQHLGVGFVSLTEALDLTTPAGRAMAGLLAVFAEFDRDILRERVRAGLAHARQQGIVTGPSVSFFVRTRRPFASVVQRWKNRPRLLLRGVRFSSTSPQVPPFGEATPEAFDIERKRLAKRTRIGPERVA
jgi:DNA invertase Pin-like site-specific DNA recombinase